MGIKSKFLERIKVCLLVPAEARSAEANNRTNQIWWRRRESNPRPQTLYRWYYMLSVVFMLTPTTRRTGAASASLIKF